jgi:hypothetical protein
MNPLLWKREHKIALVVAAGCGGMLGSTPLIFGQHIGCRALIVWLRNASYRMSQWITTIGTIPTPTHNPHDWFSLLSWTMMGAFLGAAVIYIWQLMRT